MREYGNNKFFIKFSYYIIITVIIKYESNTWNEVIIKCEDGRLDFEMSEINLEVRSSRY